VTLSFYPTPGANYTFTVYAQELPLWMTDGSTFSTGAALSEATLTSGTAWPFDEPTCRALEKAVAAEILGMTPAEELAKRGLSKDVVSLWLSQVERAKSEARKHYARQRRTSMIELRTG
jgi:hypothetical protein